MIHGPCGAIDIRSPCMTDGRCNKRFPKSFVNESVTGFDGYPQYRGISTLNRVTLVPQTLCANILSKLSTAESSLNHRDHHAHKSNLAVVFNQ